MGCVDEADRYELFDASVGALNWLPGQGRVGEGWGRVVLVVEDDDRVVGT